MKPARIQLNVIENVLTHLEMKLYLAATPSQLKRFTDAKEELIDVLADLLNHPEIAKEWESGSVSEKVNTVMHQVRQYQTKGESKEFLRMSVMVSIAAVLYFTLSAIFIYFKFVT